MLFRLADSLHQSINSDHPFRYFLSHHQGTIMALQEMGSCEQKDDWEVLKSEAEKIELQALERIIVNRDKLLVLDKLLNEVYAIRRPKPIEYKNRDKLIHVFNEIARGLYGNSSDCPVVEEFGSFSMDIFAAGSDLDLSINFKDTQSIFPRDQKINTLRKFEKTFYALQSGGHFRGVHPIMHAKVPILKVIDVGSGVECDISVENRDGIFKSTFIRLIASIDERFQKLSLLMKAWAKVQDINSSKSHTLNSFSIILLVVFHLQTRDPPILPPFSAILKGGEDLASVQKSIENFQNYGRRNTETLGELLVSFLIKLASVEKLWRKGLCASPYLGHWISKTWDTKIAAMSVEEFSDRTQNIARAVSKSKFRKIYSSIQDSIQKLKSFMNGEIQESDLKKYLFEYNQHPLVKTTIKVPKRVIKPIGPHNLSTRPPPPVGVYWGAPQAQFTATTGQEWVMNGFDHQPQGRGTWRPTMGRPGTHGWVTLRSPPVGGTGWRPWWGGAPSGGSDGAYGAAEVHWGSTVQQPYGPPFWQG
ncbi:hypothetical protein L2E82_29936 [Cichorium intybus]|uniref:Uncharacterized protein n=1 Tax=Cichorium intybus TaxID=13427 RepID=A0ACB9CZ02_CICIN|nr:hypothetical protein L2E82_29936 [Cichorium intybus]